MAIARLFKTIRMAQMALSILCVDDEPAFLELTRTYLEKDGSIRLTTATSAKEAIRLLKDRAFDAIISDYQMPGMDGIEFLKTIRRQGDSTPFIIFTGKGREDVVIQALNEGADFYLQKGGQPKPLYTELIHKVKHSVERRNASLALRKEEERFRAMAEQMVDVLFTTDGAGTIDYISPSARQVFGYSPEEMIGQCFPLFLQPGEEGKAMTAFQVTMAKGTPTKNLELNMRRRDGTIFQGEINASSLRLGGKVRGTVGLARDITERKRAEEVLRRTEADLLRVTQNMSDLLVEVDGNGTCLFASQSHERLLGYGPDDFVGKSILQFIHPEDRGRVTSALAALLKGSDVKDAEYRVIDKQGKVVWIQSIGTVLRGRNGELLGAVINSRDITDRKRVNDALRESEERLRRAEEVAGFGNWELDLKEGVMRGSQGAARLYGVDANSMDYDIVKQIPLPEYRPILDEAMRRLIRNGERYDVTIRIKRPNDGMIRDVRSMAEYDPARKVMFGVLHDVTEQKRAMDATLEAQRQLRVAMDLAKLVTWEYDAASGMFTFDDHFYAIFRTTAEREGGPMMPPSTYAERFLPPEQAHIVKDELERALATKDPNYQRRLEHDFIRRDGERGRMVVVFRTVMDDDGNVVKTFGANQDVTEQRRAELSLKRANAKLELLGGITKHDISNQLSIMSGNLALLRDGEVDEMKKRRLARLENAIDIIEKRLLFVREYQTSGSDSPIWNNVSDLIDQLPIKGNVDNLRLSKQLLGVEVLADPMLKIVFHNLLDDSIKYAAKPVTVGIHCEQKGNELVIIYEDKGPGIPQEKKEDIFHKGGSKGTGIGLYLSREILSESNITIKEVGMPGEGVRFELGIPAGQYRMVREGH